MPDPREPYGRIFHEQGRLTVNAEREKPFHVEDWDRRTREQQEIDMRGAEAVAIAERERIAAMAGRTGAVCVGDEGTSCYFADLLRSSP